MKERHVNEVRGVILFAIGLMALASLIRFDRLDLSFYTTHPNIPPRNLLGIFGAHIGNIVILLFGRFISILIPIFILVLGVKYFSMDIPYFSAPRLIGMLVLLVSSSSLVALFNPHNEYFKFYRAGAVGAVTERFVTAYFSPLGSVIIFGTLIILSLALVMEILISSLFMFIADRLRRIIWPLRKSPSRRRPHAPRDPAPAFEIGDEEEDDSPFRRRGRKQDGRQTLKEKVEAFLAEVKTRMTPASSGGDQPAARPKIQINALKERMRSVEQKSRAQRFAQPTPQVGSCSAEGARAGAQESAQKSRIGDYRLPAVDQLEIPPPAENRQIEENLESSARILEDTLEDFGISAKVTDIERGPLITRYELQPAPGVRLNKITALEDDVALSMKAQSVRIIAPIPGTGRVGVEVPNSHSSIVYLSEVLSSDAFQRAKGKLPLALGKDITGQPIVTALDDMPHILIAGTTGSGKTVCVNGLILSLLYKASPNELKFLMIDPKMVELMPYNGLPHLLCPVVTDSKKASTALNWVVAEMEGRYQLLAKASVRNIEAYNQKDGKLPYIIVVIDEFADLMTVARDQVETAVTRLAQLSRAVGIHLMLATQRPSVDVITGVIKANLPARISFKVASKVDSRTVLDANGADKLLGKGDMLFLRPGESKLIRIQGALVGDREIERVVEFIKTQGEPAYDEEILKEQHKAALGPGGQKDEFYEDAVRVVMETNQASVSVLQRRMRLGYSRAARIIDQMELEGLVGPYEGSKPRRILVDRQEWIEKNLIPNQERE